MLNNRATVNQECITKFNDLKLGKSLTYIIFKLSDDYKEVVVEEASNDKDWDNFREKLINAKSKGMGGKEVKGPRYAVYDFNYELASGEGSRYGKCWIFIWRIADGSIEARSPSSHGLRMMPELRYVFQSSFLTTAYTCRSQKWSTLPPRMPSSALSMALQQNYRLTTKTTSSTLPFLTRSARAWLRRIHKHNLDKHVLE